MELKCQSTHGRSRPSRDHDVTYTLVRGAVRGRRFVLPYLALGWLTLTWCIHGAIGYVVTLHGQVYGEAHPSGPIEWLTSGGGGKV